MSHLSFYRFATAAAFGLSISASAAMAETRLRVADSFSTTHFISAEGARYFMDAATRLSDGALQFEYFPTQQLGAAADMLEIAASGVADITYVVPSYIPDLMPLSPAVELPGMVTSSCQGTRAYWQMLAEGGPLREYEFTQNGVTPIWAFSLSAYQIGTVSAPLENIASLKGQKIRAAGTAFEMALRTLGAVPVRIAAPEVRESLVRGTIDGSVSPALSLRPYDLVTVVRHMTQGASFGGFVGTYSINTDVFESLSPEEQAILLEAGRETMEHFCNYADTSEAAAAEEFAESGGKLWVYDEKMQAELAEALAPLSADWAQRLEARGLPGNKVLDSLHDALEAQK